MNDTFNSQTVAELIMDANPWSRPHFPVHGFICLPFHAYRKQLFMGLLYAIRPVKNDGDVTNPKSIMNPVVNAPLVEMI